MISIRFGRVSVCAGDDMGNADYTIELPDSAMLGELLNVILHGGCGNDWPIPHTGANSCWVIHSNIGNLAKIITDNDDNRHIIDYCCSEDTPLKNLGIIWTFGDRE